MYYNSYDANADNDYLKRFYQQRRREERERKRQERKDMIIAFIMESIVWILFLGGLLFL